MRLNPLLPFPYETAPLPITIRQPSALPTFRVLKHFQVQILHRSVMRLGERTCASTPRHATHTSLGPCYPPDLLLIDLPFLFARTHWCVSPNMRNSPVELQRNSDLSDSCLPILLLLVLLN